MKAIILVAVVLLCTAVLAQRPRQANLYPLIADGLETVWLDDMSFVTDIHLQTYPPNNNWSFIIFGGSTVRTVFPQGHSFMVGTTPNEDWHVPFIDLHTVQNGTDVWGFGPTEPLGFPRNKSFGYELDIAVITTAQPKYRDWRFTPLGIEGTFFSVAPVSLGPYILGYFCGFFAQWNDSSVLNFGVLRAWFNLTDDPVNPSAHWNYNWTHDIAVIAPNAQFITFNRFYKPILFHLWDVAGAPTTNTTYTIVIDPGTLMVTAVTGDIDPTVPIAPSHKFWRPSKVPFGGISSAAVYYNQSLLILGIAVPGIGTGAIAFVHIANLTEVGSLYLPANYSDPKAIAVDEWTGTLYVAMNGGGEILRIDIPTMKITGYQNAPFYLARAWAARDTPDHVYFVTNEQHSKVFRVKKENFCSSPCPMFGYCEHGQCMCPPEFVLVHGQCRWQVLIHDEKVIKKGKAGEAVLGVFFALTFVAAAVGWFLVWKGKRQGYQAV